MGDIQPFHHQQGAGGLTEAQQADGRTSAERESLSVATPALPVPGLRAHQLFSPEP